MAEPTVPVCWICGAPLRVAITRNRHAKTALTLWCGEDGRHLRAFCNHRPVVEEVVARLEAQAAVTAPAAGTEPAAPAQQALQNDSGGPERPKSTRKRRAG
jgi:hypothetical protein